MFKLFVILPEKRISAQQILSCQLVLQISKIFPKYVVVSTKLSEVITNLSSRNNSRLKRAKTMSTL